MLYAPARFAVSLRRQTRLHLAAVALVSTAVWVTTCAPIDKPTQVVDSIDAARSLPYVEHMPAGDSARTGVASHDPERAEGGLNLLHPGSANRASLVDMEGRTVRQWSARVKPNDGWHHVEPTPDGGLAAVHKLGGVTRLDAGSRVLWRRDDLLAHHDAAPTSDGGLWVIARRVRWVEGPADPAGPPSGALPIVDDLLVRLDAQGRTVREISVFDVLGDHIPAHWWQSLRAWLRLRREQGLDRREIERWADQGSAQGGGSPREPFHLNSLEPVTRAVPGVAEVGDLLICARELDLVAVVDPTAERLRWSWGAGELQRPHHPSLLPGGHLLVFDNGPRRGWSRVIEVDPQSGEIVWQYGDHPSQRFFSAIRGAVQRLPGGNTLITESDAGRVFEVTPEGEVVWELLAPLDHSAGSPSRFTLYRLRRLPYDSPLGGRIPSPSAK